MSSDGMKGVAILGSTGSVGEHTLDVIARHPDRFRVVALGANRNVEKLADQCLRFSVPYAALGDTTAAARLESELRARKAPTQVIGGADALVEIAALPEVRQRHGGHRRAPPGCARRSRRRAPASDCC